MADNISVSITGDATQLRVATEVAKQYLKDYTSAVKEVAVEMKATGTASQALQQKVEDTAAAYSKAAAAARDLRAAQSQVAASSASLAVNYQQVINSTTGVGRALSSAEDSADVFRTALGDASNGAKALKAAFSEVDPAAHGAASGSAAITRELIVMGHEAIQGRFSRIPGSMMVLGEHTGAVTSVLGSMTAGMWAAAGGVAVLAAGIAVLVVRAVEAEHALNAVTAAAAFMGRSTDEAAAGAARVGDSLRDAGMGRTDINAVNTAIARMAGTTQDLREKFAGLAPALRAAFPEEDVDKYFGALINAADGGVSAVRKYLQEADALNDTNLKGLATAEATNDKAGAQAILYDTMKARLAGYNAELLRRQAIIDEQNKSASGDFQQLTVQQFPILSLPQSPLPQAQAEDPQQVKNTETAIRYSAELRQQVALTQALTEAQGALGTARVAGDAAGIANASAAIKTIQSDLANLKAPGETGWAAQIAQQAQAAGDAAVTAAAAAGQKREVISEAAARAEMQVYEAASKDMTRSDEQRNAMAARAIQLHMTLVKEDAGNSTTWAARIAQQAQAAGDAAVTAAAAAGQKRQQITEAGTRAELAIYQAASKDMSRTDEERNSMAARAIQLHMSLVREDAGAAETAAKKTAAEIIAGYDQQLSEARGNLAQVEAIETQKLAFLQATYGKASAEYEKGLSEQTAALRQAIGEETAAIKQAGTQQIEDRKAELDLEVAQHRMSKAAEAAAEIQFNDQVHAAELKAVDDLKATLAQGTAAYADAQKIRDNLAVQFALEHERLLAQQTADENAAAQKADQAWTSAFDRIGSIADSSITNLISGRESYLKIERSAAQEVIQLGVQEGLHWISLEAAKTAATAFGTTARIQDEQTAGNASWGPMLADWLGLEGAKTAATTAGAASRATADSGGGFLSEISTMVARWLGMETAKTAATTAAASVRASADAVGAAAGAATVAAQARLSVAAAAAVAAAWAFADTAETGPQGLVAAPAAAGAAELLVMSYQAAIPGLASGTSYVPSDMVQLIHQGEMVVPRYDADLIRGGGVSGPTFHYSPTISGGGPDLSRQVQQNHEDFKAYIANLTRNGQLALPGRAQRRT